MLSLAAVLAASCLAVQDPPKPPPPHVQVPGTQVLLAPPPGFALAERYSGFESVETGASILVTEVAGPYSEVAKGFDAAGFERGGMKLIESKPAEIAGRAGALFRAKRVAQGVTFVKWIGVFGDEKRTVQVVTNCPEAAVPALGDALRACVAGARWDRSLKVDPFAHLTFTIAVPPELVFAARMQNMLLFTRSGEVVKKEPSEPALTVGASLGAPAITDLETFAARRLRQLPSISDVAFDTSRAVEIAGLSGWEIGARAVQGEGATPIFVYQVLLADDSGYHLLVAMAGEELRATYLPVFEKAARSFALKPVAKPGDAPKK
jgi:hypothetical protein